MLPSEQAEQNKVATSSKEKKGFRLWRQLQASASEQKEVRHATESVGRSIGQNFQIFSSYWTAFRYRNDLFSARRRRKMYA
jgi:hypothetical protein